MLLRMCKKITVGRDGGSTATAQVRMEVPQKTKTAL